MFKVKNTNMLGTSTPEAQIFVCFALRWAIFSYGPIFGKVLRMTRNDPDMFKVKKNPTCIHPWDPNFRKFRYTMSHFLSYGPIFEKGTEWPNWSWNVQGQKYQHPWYTHPRGPNFRPFHSTISRFWVMGQFSEKCTKWPQMTLKYQHACYLHPRG